MGIIWAKNSNVLEEEDQIVQKSLEAFFKPLQIKR